MSTVLITGCGSGFGRLSALDLARRGVRVVATLRSPDRSDLAELAEKEGLPLSVHRLDVTDPASIESALAASGPVDVLVNNAGYAQRGPLETLSDDEIARQFDTNVTGVLRMVRAVVPAMRARGSGRIVNVSSSSGLFAAPYEGVYSASKHALEALSQVLAFELHGSGVQVRLVEPGAFETGFVAGAPVAGAFTPDHPLWDEYHRFWEKAAGLTGGQRSDPRAVVDAIRHAALDDDAPFRQLVGDDAKFIVESQMAAGLADTTPLIREALDL